MLGHAHSTDQVHSTDLQVRHGSNGNNNTDCTYRRPTFPINTMGHHY